MTLTAAADGSIHADGCVIVGCPVWIAANAGSCIEPYPCMCDVTKASAPEYVQLKGTPQCWWVDRNTGRIKSRCPCWGTPRDGRPGACCAHHSSNPIYQVTAPVGLVDAEDDPAVTGQHTDDTAVTAGETDAAPLPEDWTPDDPDVPADWRERWPDEERKPYVRLFESASLTCDCVLPYAKDKHTAALHCVEAGCHRDFANAMAFEIHRKWWTEPCRDPADVVDCWTGLPLMECQGGIWRLHYESTYRPAGWTPGRFHRSPAAA